MANTENPGSPHLPSGGQGEADAKLSRSDMAMLKKAAEDRWPVSETHRRAAVAALSKILTAQGEDGPSHRDRIAAIKAFVAMDKTSLDWRRFEHETKVRDADDFHLELDLAPKDPEAHEPDGTPEAVPGE